MEELRKEYLIKKEKIKQRLSEFKEDKDLFTELVFCLCTPQSKARACDKAVKSLVFSKAIVNGNEGEIKKHLLAAGVRFHHNKARYIVGTRELFRKVDLKEKLREKDQFSLREWLVKNVKGIGMKEAGHFLRNVGLYEELTILDRHILKNLMKYGVVKRMPKTLTKKKYLSIEKKMKQFAQEINIPHAELDLLFWSQETGEIFK